MKNVRIKRVLTNAKYDIDNIKKDDSIDISIKTKLMITSNYLEQCINDITPAAKLELRDDLMSKLGSEEAIYVTD